jgi:hypothetical protein
MYLNTSLDLPCQYTVVHFPPHPCTHSFAQMSANSIEGSRKRKPTKRATENGDPLARKRPKTTLATTTTASTQSGTNPATLSNSVVAASASPPCGQSRASRAQHSTPEVEDKSDGDAASETEPIDVGSDSDSDSVQVIEDDDSELGECCVWFPGSAN